MKLFGTMMINNNELEVGGVNALLLAKQYGTPLYVLDEKLIRDNCRKFKMYFNGNDKVVYASKALSTIKMIQIINEEDMYLDVVSEGEIYLAYVSKFPMDKVIFHGSNKSFEELDLAVKLNVGVIVIDNFYEMDLLNDICKKNNKVQDIFIRIAPGIEAHTHEYIKTGQDDSKFGFTMINDMAMNAVSKAINYYDNFNLLGVHCHIGSQIFDIEPYIDSVNIMINFIRDIKDKFGYIINKLDLGGGFGVYYTEGDNPSEISNYCKAILTEVQKCSNRLKILRPDILIEPGRSIVANAGITLYKVGAIKDIPGIRKYISIDGGMTDNIRPALYKAKYECILCNKVNDSLLEEVRIAGKCCESGDILIDSIKIPKCKSGDILAVMSTGAYCYSMSSEYNKQLKPAMVIVNEGKSRLIIKRENYMDLINNEVLK